MRLYPESEELFAIAKNWDYGTIKTHEEIAQIMKLEPKSKRYYTMMCKVKKKMLDIQKMLKSVVKIGYEITKPNDYPDEVIRQITQSKRKANYALKVAQLAPVDKMDFVSLQRHRSVTDRAQAFNAMVADEVIKVKLLK